MIQLLTQAAPSTLDLTPIVQPVLAVAGSVIAALLAIYVPRALAALWIVALAGVAFGFLDLFDLSGFDSPFGFTQDHFQREEHGANNGIVIPHLPVDLLLPEG